MAVSKRIARRRKTSALAPHIRVLVARVRLDSFDSPSDDDSLSDDDGAVSGAITQTDRQVEDDEGYERVLRERRRRHFTRLCVEQLYRFEEA